jgi:hypothetical protein
VQSIAKEALLTSTAIAETLDGGKTWKQAVKKWKKQK